MNDNNNQIILIKLGKNYYVIFIYIIKVNKSPCYFCFQNYEAVETWMSHRKKNESCATQKKEF